jgi:hypothetical protein
MTVWGGAHRPHVRVWQSLRDSLFVQDLVRYAIWSASPERRILRTRRAPLERGRVTSAG